MSSEHAVYDAVVDAIEHAAAISTCPDDIYCRELYEELAEAAFEAINAVTPENLGELFDNYAAACHEHGPQSEEALEHRSWINAVITVSYEIRVTPAVTHRTEIERIAKAQMQQLAESIYRLDKTDPFVREQASLMVDEFAGSLAIAIATPFEVKS